MFIKEQSLLVDTALYSQKAVFRAAYLFTNLCYLFMQPEGQQIRVYFEAKGAADKDYQRFMGDFVNELVNQQLRLDIIGETSAIREMIVAQAFAEGDLLDKIRDSGSFVEDPLGIARTR